jgi:hypothetical protein
MLIGDPDIRRLVALRAAESGLLRLKWLAAATRFELALSRHDRALKQAYWFKYGFNPNQPRVLAGNPDGGQWTDDGSSSGRIRLAGEIPTGDSPEVPKEPPPTTRLRNILIRNLARRLGPYIWVAAEAGSWIYDHKEEINSYFDPPRSLEELQDAANSPEKGYDIHHIVERNSAAKDGSEADLIDSPKNLARVPPVETLADQ